jgi:hypothetical protein
MKIHGVKLDTPNEEVVVIPRKSGDIVIRAKAILDDEEFLKLCPTPTPPEVIRAGGARSLDINDKDYLKKMDDWAANKTHWMVLKSLEATEGLEWDNVNMSDPATWSEYSKELQVAGFSQLEIVRILTAVTDACGLNQDKIEEATKRFLAGQVATQEKLSSQSSEQKDTPSSEPVKDSK